MVYEVHEENGLKFCASVEEDGETKAKSLLLMTVEEGISYTLGNVNARDVAKGKGAERFGDVLPQLLFEKKADGKETTNLQKINERLKEILQDVQNPVNSGRAWDFKKVHQEVCRFVENDPRTDYYTIAEGKCRVRGTDLQPILDELGTGWSAHRFAKTLQLHNMLYTDGGRLQKWLTDSSGKGKQYRAYVFDTGFKRLELDE